ncbi:MAG: hypothetical protein IJ648_00555 [Lachnospiraceae bacterium]|nr:hypothetical protein [Lachnospiraceae bacterium]
MEVNRKLNALGAIIGAVGVFGIIFCLLILMNSVQFMKGIVDQGQVTIPASSGLRLEDQDGNMTYRIVYATDDGNVVVELPATEKDLEDFSPETAEPIVRKVFVDGYGNYYSYDDLNATAKTVVQDVNMPMTLPIVGACLSLVIAIAGFVWAFKGKPSKGKDLGEIIQAKREAEEAEEASMKSEEEAEKSDEDGKAVEAEQPDINEDVEKPEDDDLTEEDTKNTDE